jgi:hypothetical protein
MTYHLRQAAIQEEEVENAQEKAQNRHKSEFDANQKVQQKKRGQQIQ